MKPAFKRKYGGAVAMCVLAMGVASGAAIAQSDWEKKALVLDQRGGVVKSGFGLCWRSGTGPAPVSTPECDPNYAVPPVAKAETAPKPMAAVTPDPAPIPVTQRVTLDADTLFDFNKADLRPAGRLALDDFAAKTRDIDRELITAVGHADRFGTEAYNQTLSEQRAASVKTYLVSKGIAANRVHSEGRGEMQPVTKAGECLGAKSANVVACLQADRRVEVEVVGSKIIR